MIRPKMEYKDDVLKIYLNNLSGEGDIGIPKVNLTIRSVPIVGKIRKLKWVWTRHQKSVP